MNKITSYHLNLIAIIYIRQSTQAQVNHNLESKRRQYKLKEKAEKLGFKKVEVIDDDLGKSGSGSCYREGFDRLLSKICQGKIGAIFALEASRLARNGREWHTLLEMCAIMNTLIIDPEGIYNPKLTNDRLLLGMKGTISEMELSILRERAHLAIREKAKRGEYYNTVAVGYKKTEDDKLEKHPNLRVQEVIDLIFKKFRELPSIRQVYTWFQDKKIKAPTLILEQKDKPIYWRLPTYSTIKRVLHNPIYAGAYVFGRREVKTIIKDGKKHKICKNKEQNDWLVLIKNHHDGYISWDEYEEVFNFVEVQL